MQIANGIVVLSPENQQFKYGITPAEALILHKLHFKNSNGAPLKDFIVTGEARTIDVEFKAGEPEYLDRATLRTVPAVPDRQEVSHARTNSEEAQRLRRKYTGLIKGQTAFVSVFGNQTILNLPATFDEIAEAVGCTFDEGEFVQKEPTLRDKLLKYTKSQLIAEAEAKGLTVENNTHRLTLVKLLLDHAEAVGEKL